MQNIFANESFEGAKGCRENKNYNDNPYEFGTEQFWSWYHGFGNEYYDILQENIKNDLR